MIKALCAVIYLISHKKGGGGEVKVVNEQGNIWLYSSLSSSADIS